VVRLVVPFGAASVQMHLESPDRGRNRAGPRQSVDSAPNTSRTVDIAAT